MTSSFDHVQCETTISNPKEASTKPALEPVHDQALGLGTDGLENEGDVNTTNTVFD